jgi:hypothetical protein
MSFRQRAKALFRPKSRTDSNSKSSKSSKSSSRDRWPSNVYKPGEVMPRPKYRRPPTKEHKEKLEAFSFAGAWRRKSHQSEYTPMGTRVPSRRASLFSLASRKKSYTGSVLGPSRRHSRANSVTSAGTEGSGMGPASRRRERGFAVTRLSTETEVDGDDDIANVGISRVQSQEYAQSRHRVAPNRHSFTRVPTMSTAHDHQPFSEQDLALALQRSHLAVPT